MDVRMAVAAGLVSFTAGVTLGVYEVQGWTMPTPLAVAIVAVMAVTGLSAGIYLAHALWIFATPIRRGWSLRFPIYKRRSGTNSPPATEEESDKWIHTVLMNDSENVQRGVFLFNKGIDWHNFKMRSPYIIFEIEIYNALVYDVRIGAESSDRVDMDNTPLNQQIEVRHTDNPDVLASNLRHAFPGKLSIRQHLSSDEKTAILQRAERDVTFTFTNVNISIECFGTDGIPGPTSRLQIPSWGVAVPRLAELAGDGGQV